MTFLQRTANESAGGLEMLRQVGLFCVVHPAAQVADVQLSRSLLRIVVSNIERGIENVRDSQLLQRVEVAGQPTVAEEQTWCNLRAAVTDHFVE